MIIEERGQTNEGYEYIIGIDVLGHRLGYVGVYEDSSLYNISYTKDENDDADKYIDTVEYNVHVHGGLTYSGGLDQNVIGAKNPYYFGFDCAHLGDGKISTTEMKEILDRHCSQMSTLAREEIIIKYSQIFKIFPDFGEDSAKELAFVKNECFHLSSQLKDLELKYEDRKA